MEDHNVHEGRRSGGDYPPLAYLLQGVPTECRPVLEDVIERVQGAQLPPLLLVINGGRGHRGWRRQWGGEGGRGG